MMNVTPRYHLCALIILVLLMFCSPHSSQAKDYEKLAPFSSCRWTDAGLPEVKIGKNWFSLRSINDVPVEDIIVFCRGAYGNNAKKRFTEDLVEVLSKMGKPPGEQVTLGVRHVDTGAEQVLRDIPMTSANRRALRLEARSSMPLRSAAITTISAAQAMEDIDSFQQQLESRFAYLKANNVDYKSALDRIRAKVSDPMKVDDLQSDLGKVISMFIDGHASPRGKHPDADLGRHLPFIMETAGNRFVAVNPDRNLLLDDYHPYVVQLDGIDLERWLAAMDPFVNQGSSQNIRRRCARHVRCLDFGRKLLGLPENNELSVGLVSADGIRRVTQKIHLPNEHVSFAPLPKKPSRILDGNVGYLRIASFSGETAVELVKEWMPQFRETAGLIVDVRYNQGGSRKALLELFPYLLKPGEAHVGNVCAYRLYADFDEDHLAARFAYRETDDRWDDNERAVIKRFKTSFRPEWELPKGDFSKWHYLVLSKRSDDPRYHYDKPVILLTNSYCFSATDIFVGAFKGFRNVTIVGQSTGGGSARSQSESLPNSNMKIRLASMASFQPNGLLYDGRGVSVDISVDPTPESFLLGGKDNILQHAIDLVRSLPTNPSG